MHRRFERFVAIGDSTAEGVGDPHPAGGHRGFADRLAERLAVHQGSVEYANLAVSGAVAGEIRAGQLGPALALRPDLVAIMAGMNDLLRLRFDARAIAGDVGAMQHAFAAAGCVVIAFTLPDVAHRLAMPPLHHLLSRRTRALNAAIRTASARSGARLIDLAAYATATDPRLWNRDRLHGNAAGHERIAAACAQVLELPGADHAWAAPLAAPAATGFVARLAEDLGWSRAYLAPWLWARARRRPAMTPRVAKRPALRRITRGV